MVGGRATTRGSVEHISTFWKWKNSAVINGVTLMYRIADHIYYWFWENYSFRTDLICSELLLIFTLLNFWMIIWNRILNNSSESEYQIQKYLKSYLVLTFWTIIQIWILGTLFFDASIFLVGARPLNPWIRTFQRYLWPYFWV